MSGIGKGVIAASIGKILQARKLRVTAVKIDPYLNYDAGTMNPYIHGEVFVTEDGGETDMDIGTYERFLDINVPKSHNITTGQIYSSVIERERRGDFLGKCVQIIPHITDEIKDRLRNIAREDADVVIVEIGGTVGDIESLPYLEAARQFRFDEGIGNVVNVHVTLVPMLDVVGEQKTKPTQHSVQELRRIGVIEALRDAGATLNAKVDLEFIETDDFETDPSRVRVLSGFDGLLVPAGFGSRGSEGKIRAIEYARTHNIPFLGICFGFQLAVVEYARSLGMMDAASSELSSNSKNYVIDLMPEQNSVLEKGGTMRLGAHEISIDTESIAYSLYQKTKAWERHRHRYEVNPKFIPQLTSKGLRFSGKSDANRRMEILELPTNTFHFATQYHAEFKSRPGRPSPPYLGLVKASLSKNLKLEPKQVMTRH